MKNRPPRLIRGGVSRMLNASRLPVSCRSMIQEFLMTSRRSFLQSVGGGSLALGFSGAFAGEGVSPAPIKIGQIGVGHAHASKLSVYRKSKDYEVVGVVEPDPELRKRAEGEATYNDLSWMK